MVWVVRVTMRGGSAATAGLTSGQGPSPSQFAGSWRPSAINWSTSELELKCPGRISAAEIEDAAGDEDVPLLTRRAVLASGALAGMEVKLKVALQLRLLAAGRAWRVSEQSPILLKIAFGC